MAMKGSPFYPASLVGNRAKEHFMNRVAVKIEHRGEAFVVLVPAVPGCVFTGKSREEALTKTRDALQSILKQAGPGFSFRTSAIPSHDLGDVEYVNVGASAAPSC